MKKGILGLPVYDTPIAILDFETTGLSAGIDRVVEVSVIRREPDGSSKIVLDTLVNPQRTMGATDIHGISDADVTNAPIFNDIAEGLFAAISGCVLGAYNVYFDMRFFEYEMNRAGFSCEPPHICLMYLRPLLGLGKKCPLGVACDLHDVPYSGSHMAGDDALAAAKLFECYLEAMRNAGVHSFHDLSRRGSYKFLRSFSNNTLRCDQENHQRLSKKMCSRIFQGKNITQEQVADPLPTRRNGIAAYWDMLKAAVADLIIDDEEIECLRQVVEEYGLQREQIRMIHARAFASVINQFISDKCLDGNESRKLKQLHQCLSKIGWAPGE